MYCFKEAYMLVCSKYLWKYAHCIKNLKPTEMRTEKDGIFVQDDLPQQKYFRKNN